MKRQLLYRKPRARTMEDVRRDIKNSRSITVRFVSPELMREYREMVGPRGEYQDTALHPFMPNHLLCHTEAVQAIYPDR